MKTTLLTTLAIIASCFVSSCCCQGEDAPGLRKMPRFNDLGQPIDAPIQIFKGKK